MQVVRFELTIFTLPACSSTNWATFLKNQLYKFCDFYNLYSFFSFFLLSWARLTNISFSFLSITQNPPISTTWGFETMMFEFWDKNCVLVASSYQCVLLSYTWSKMAIFSSSNSQLWKFCSKQQSFLSILAHLNSSELNI